MTSEEFATELLREEKVAVVPGSAFGASGEGYIRISYAYSLDDLKEALGRVNHFIEKLRKNRGFNIVKKMLIKPENKEKMKGKRHICKHTGMSLSASNLFIICKKYQLG